MGVPVLATEPRIRLGSPEEILESVVLFAGVRKDPTCRSCNRTHRFP